MLENEKNKTVKNFIKDTLYKDMKRLKKREKLEVARELKKFLDKILLKLLGIPIQDVADILLNFHMKNGLNFNLFKELILIQLNKSLQLLDLL